MSLGGGRRVLICVMSILIGFDKKRLYFSLGCITTDKSTNSFSSAQT